MSAPQSFFLIVESGGAGGRVTGRVVVLPSAPFVIGRESSCDLALADPEVSRQHARLVPAGTGYRLEDLGSTNGTFVNDRQITAPVLLNPGDRVRLGDHATLRFDIGDPDQADTPRSAPVVDTAGRQPLHLEGAGLAGSYEPPSAYTPTPIYYGPAVTLAEGGRPRWRLRLLGCGCLLVLAAIACGAAVFWLDANRPDLLYGALRSLFDWLGF